MLFLLAREILVFIPIEPRLPYYRTDWCPHGDSNPGRGLERAAS